MPPMSTNHPRRRWLQFSLRTFLVALTFLAILLGGWVNRARRQREAVAAIRAAHGEVVYDYHWATASDWLKEYTRPRNSLSEWLGEDYFQHVLGAILDNSEGGKFDGRAFQYISDLSDIKLLDVGAGATDANLGSIAGLRELRVLTLRSPQITDAGLAHLAPLKRLTDLAIWDGRINGSGFKHLRGLTKLNSLNLTGPWVDDAVLLQVAEIPSLKSIELVDANITDIGLSHLTKLTSLELLELSGTHVTDAGRCAFRRAMPNCKLK